MKNVAVNCEMLVEDKQIREKYIGKTEVLNKVKVLSLLPDDEYATIKMVADYFDTNKTNIDFLLNFHKEEFESDGVKILVGDELRHYKSTCLTELGELKRIPKITLMPRRAILRCGMLLRVSEVAKWIRTYLLDIEQSSTKEQKTKATKGSDWESKELVLYDMIVTEINKGGTLTSACEKASIKLNKTVGACKNRYSSHIKQKIHNDDLIRRIENNKHGALKLVESESDIIEDLLPETEWCRTPSREELFYNAVICMIEGIETHVKSQDNEVNRNKDAEIERLTKENSALYNKNKRLYQEKKTALNDLHQAQAVIGAAIKVRVDEEISATFKMDKNGNLERIS